MARSAVDITATLDTSTDYTLDDFETNWSRERWTVESGGQDNKQYTTGNGSQYALTGITNAGGEFILTRSMWTAFMRDFDTISFDVNFNGNTFLTASDTPALIFDQSGWKYILLHNFATNGSAAWQHVSIPFSKFTANGDATSGSAGTGTAFDHTATLTGVKLRVYENVAGKRISLDNIVLSDSTGTNLVEDFSQPGFLTKGRKMQNSFFFKCSGDVMKYTKDVMAGQKSQSEIDAVTAALKTLGCTHVAVSCPYDSAASYASPVTAGYLNKWVSSVRAQGMNMFYRQTANEFEAIYSAPKNGASGLRAGGTAKGVLAGSEPNTYLKQLYDYVITNGPTLYQEGDMICPFPEPEGSGITGVAAANVAPDTWSSNSDFLKFLRDGITVVNKALATLSTGSLRGKVFVGLYGQSGFITLGNVDNPNGFLDVRTVDAMGVVGMDHYPNPYTDMSTDLANYRSKYQKPFMLCEWGTINEGTDAARLSAVSTVTNALKSMKDAVSMNYWTVIGGANENVLDSGALPIGGYNNLKTAFITNTARASSGARAAASSRGGA